MSIRKIFEQRKLILEGVINSLFRKEHIEKIATERRLICETNACKSYDKTGEGCSVSGTQPCCDERNGGCGCSLKYATRSMSKECPKGFWESVLTDDEEEKVYKEINYNLESE